MIEGPHPYMNFLKELDEKFTQDWADLHTLRRITGTIYYARIAMDNALVQKCLHEIDNFYRPPNEN